MTTLIFEAAIAVTAASAGAAAGWCLRRSREAGPTETRAVAEAAKAAVEREAENNRQATKDLLSQVHGLTTKVASQVGEHNLRVQAINDQLVSGDQQDVQSIAAALDRLVEANAWMQQQLASAETKLESQARLIESHVNEARTDALTGIANRRAFDEEMQRCLAALRLQNVPACVMMIDVDHFKRFNDTHGHKAGDEVLRHVANALKQAAAGSGTVCRYGGEEFAVIFPKLPAAAVVSLAERCRTAIGAQGIAYDGKTLNVSASAGLAEFSARDTLETVLERADEALYESKRNGRDCGHLHNGADFVPFTAPVPQDKPVPPEKPSGTKVTSGLVDIPTGLATEQALREDLLQRLIKLERDQEPLCLMLVQVNRLRQWSDKAGAEGQSVALRKVSTSIRNVVGTKHYPARFGDDMFGVALHAADRHAAADIALKLRCDMQTSQAKVEGIPAPITLTIGICEAVAGDDVAKLIRRGQLALNAAGSFGGNAIAMHDGTTPTMIDDALLPA